MGNENQESLSDQIFEKTTGYNWSTYRDIWMEREREMSIIGKYTVNKEYLSHWNSLFRQKSWREKRSTHFSSCHVLFLDYSYFLFFWLVSLFITMHHTQHNPEAAKNQELNSFFATCNQVVKYAFYVFPLILRLLLFFHYFLSCVLGLLYLFLRENRK